MHHFHPGEPLVEREARVEVGDWQGDVGDTSVNTHAFHASEPHYTPSSLCRAPSSPSTTTRKTPTPLLRPLECEYASPFPPTNSKRRSTTRSASLRARSA